jgi:hypothetical protein
MTFADCAPVVLFNQAGAFQPRGSGMWFGNARLPPLPPEPPLSGRQSIDQNIRLPQRIFTLHRRQPNPVKSKCPVRHFNLANPL